MKVLYISKPYVVAEEEDGEIVIGRVGSKMFRIAVPLKYGHYGYLGPDIRDLEFQRRKGTWTAEYPSDFIRKRLETFFASVWSSEGAKGTTGVIRFIIRHLHDSIEEAADTAFGVEFALRDMDIKKLVRGFREEYPGECTLDDAVKYVSDRVKVKDNDGIRYFIRTKFKDFLEEDHD